MSRGPELPFTGNNNPVVRASSNSEQQNEIVWVDSEDVYKPIFKKISEFRAVRGIIEDEVGPVYIKADALANLKEHLKSDLRVEQGGILFGNAYEDEFLGIYVEITAAVAAPATIGTGAHLEFTSDSWLGIMDYAQAEHPQENIVGWYHSHPNIGVFMSGTDMNTQRAFFHHAWCLSIVHDPVRGDIGYFLGETAKPVQPIIFRRIGQYAHQVEQYQTTNSYVPNQPEIPQGGLTRTEKFYPKQAENPATSTIPESPGRKRRGRSSVPPWLWFILLAALVIILGKILLPNILPSFGISESAPSSPNPPIVQAAPRFNAHMENMPATVFTYLEKSPSLLRYPIVKAGKELGRGDEITLLVISQEETGTAKEVQLEVEQFTPTKNTSTKYAEVVDYLKTPEKSLINYGSSEKHLVDLTSLKPEGGVAVPMLSSHVSSKKSAQVKEVRDILYIPRRIIYKDSSNTEKKVEINEILKESN